MSLEMNKSINTDVNEKQKLSIVVPAYNEAPVIAEFHRRLVAVLDVLPLEAEIIYINDGSKDQTLSILNTMMHYDKRINIVDLSRNFGKEIALSAGLDHASGDAVVVIDADLQDPPELIPDMLVKWHAGSDVVFMKRSARHGETWLKKSTAALFYRLLQRIGEIDIPEDVGDFRLLSRRVLEALKTCRERTRFMKGLFAWVGFDQTVIEYSRDGRFAGETKWNYWKLWNFALEGIVSFSTAPLKMASYIGILAALAAFGYSAVVVLKTLMFGEVVQGFPTLIVVILFLGGLQLMGLGIIGEYLARMFIEVKQRPLYLLKGVYTNRDAAVTPETSQKTS